VERLERLGMSLRLRLERTQEDYLAMLLLQKFLFSLNIKIRQQTHTLEHGLRSIQTVVDLAVQG